jgi:hemoglobin
VPGSSHISCHSHIRHHIGKHGGVSSDDPSPGARPRPAPQPVAGPPRRDPAAHGDDEYQVTIFSAVGGQPFFDRLVGHFYDRVATDDVLLRLYPDQVDLGPARQRLALFLGQYWGGPTTYSDERGHPRLRMRHAPFAIGTAERDHWVHAMLAALDETMPSAPLDDDLQAAVRERMQQYFTMAADSMVNVDR